MSFYEHIKKYSSKDYIRFHTPAHRGRNEQLNRLLNSNYDLTELDETDNLFAPNGIIKKSQDEFAEILNASEVFYLVNGATSGIMAVLSLFNEGDKIIVDRNCHISVINGILNSKLQPVFMDPEFDYQFNIPLPPSPFKIKDAINKHKNAKAVFLTSPNYYGLMCDLKEIRKIAHIKIIVDEAHGSHLYFSNRDKTALYNNCDISILSMHKTLTALTQCGAVAIKTNCDLKDRLKYFTSTSPSYLLMMSIDASFRYMNYEGKRRLLETEKRCVELKNKLMQIENIKVLDENYICDKTRLTINISNFDEKLFLDVLKEKYKIIPEFCDGNNIVFIISLHNYDDEILKLYHAIENISKNLKVTKKEKKLVYKLPKMMMLPYVAKTKEHEKIPKENAVGRICAECIIDFPPSVPILSYGECVEKEILPFIHKEKIKVIK